MAVIHTPIAWPIIPGRMLPETFGDLQAFLWLLELAKSMAFFWDTFQHSQEVLVRGSGSGSATQLHRFFSTFL